MVEMEFEAVDVKHDGLIVGVGSLKFEDDLVEVEFEEIFEFGLFVAIAVSVFAGVLMIPSDWGNDETDFGQIVASLQGLQGVVVGVDEDVEFLGWLDVF